jgi:hypothetical protein
VNNIDSDGSTLRWLNSLHGLIANTTYPVLLSLVDDTSSASLTTAFVVTSMVFNTNVTEIYGTNITIPFPSGMGVNMIFTIEAGSGGSSGTTSGSNYTWLAADGSDPPLSGTFTTYNNNSLRFNTTTLNGTDSAPWFLNIGDVLAGYEGTLGAIIPSFVSRPTHVLLTLSSVAGTLLEIKLSLEKPGLTSEGGYIILSLTNVDFLFLKTANVSNQIFTLSWRPLYEENMVLTENFMVAGAGGGSPESLAYTYDGITWYNATNQKSWNNAANIPRTRSANTTTATGRRITSRAV